MQYTSFQSVEKFFEKTFSPSKVVVELCQDAVFKKEYITAMVFQGEGQEQMIREVSGLDVSFDCEVTDEYVLFIIPQET